MKIGHKFPPHGGNGKHLFFWRHATILPRVFLRSLHYGIVVLGFLDAFVYAHHKHRFDSANAGNL